jgi:hypothetical protein
MLKKIAHIPYLIVFAGSAVMAAGGSSVPPASFLNYHVATVQELSQEVTLDPAVRGRLARHFHITPSQMTTYIRRNLVLTRLHTSGSYRIACIRRNGREFWVESKLPAGTPVFASRITGNPVLKLACGNPMVSSLPPGLQIAEDNGLSAPPQLASLPILPPTTSTPAPSLLPDAATVPDLSNGPMIADNVVPPVIQVSPYIDTFTNNLGNAVSHGFNFGPALAGVAAAAAAAVALNKGHSNSSTPLVPAVPESSTSVSFGLMLLFGSSLVIVFRRKRPTFD